MKQDYVVVAREKMISDLWGMVASAAEKKDAELLAMSYAMLAELHAVQAWDNVFRYSTPSKFRNREDS